MYKSISFYAAFGKTTGYQFHASQLCDELEKLLPVYRNQLGGEVSISLIDSVSIQNVNNHLPYPSFIMNAWESDHQPDWFIEKLKYFDGLMVVSNWQKACSVAQGIPEEFIYVVPEGINSDIFTALAEPISETFNFLHVGQFQPRKSTIEICQSFIKAFPDNQNVSLFLAADTNFPSDNFQSTEERLIAYQINDSRIIPIRFEEHLNDEKLIKLLSSSHVFTSCSRAEGWGMPMCISMACGIPTIVCDYSGSTEYAEQAIKVPVAKMIEPFGIYGNWKVPGQWAEPDFDVLVTKMQDVYQNYPNYKKEALQTSEYIRREFSWEKAAQKAYEILEELSRKSQETINPKLCVDKPPLPLPSRCDKLPLRNAIFIVDCWPSIDEKITTLSETISQIHELGYPVLVTSHYPIPQSIITQTDFYLYEKRDIMSGTDKPIYWRQRLDGTTETKECGLEYQGVAALNCARNAIDFCRGKYEWIYQMSADIEVDLEDWLRKVHAAPNPLVFMAYEGVQNGFGGGLWAATSEMADKVFPYLTSWQQYAEMFPDVRFVAERWIYNYIATKVDIDSAVSWITCETRNRFDNVDRDIWKEDEFQFHFVDGPYLNIVGLSNKEYDVTYSNPIDGDFYVLKQKPGVWSKPNTKFYRDWTIAASLDGEVKFHHKFDLSGQRVLISSGSKALGDTIAWVPYIDEFRKKHNCHIVFSSWWNGILDYPEIELVTPGSAVANIYASYDVGCFDTQPDKNPFDWRTIPLQKVSADILGIDYVPLKAKLKYTPYKPSGNGNPPKPYICFSEFSTMQNKMWNREGAWQKVIDYVNLLGYDCVSISVEKSNLSNVISHNGQNVERTLTDMDGCEFYIGLNAGPSWLAYAMNIPVIMIDGVAEEWNSFPNPYRIAVEVGCKPCFNNTDIPIDRGWDWCVNKEKFACTKAIAPEMVIEVVNKIVGKEQFGEYARFNVLQEATL